MRANRTDKNSRIYVFNGEKISALDPKPTHLFAQCDTYSALPAHRQNQAPATSRVVNRVINRVETNTSRRYRGRPGVSSL